MFASSRGPRARRRGIVLILVLGMLGLMALIGVTFASFAGQSLINSRNFAQGVSRPQSEVLMDYALAQLINDTNNPLSAIRGHSLLRDMYGNDSVFRGNNPSANPAAETGGVLSSIVLANGTTSTLHLSGPLFHPAGTNGTPFYNQLQYATNIPTNGQYYGLDFTRWIVRFPNGLNTTPGPINVPQTFEILEDDATTGVHLFTLSNNLTNPTSDPTYVGASPLPTSASDWTSFIYYDPNLGATVSSGTVSKTYTSLAREQVLSQLSPATNTISNPFVLDGRYMRAFNGPGLTRLDPNTTTRVYPYNIAAYANFRLSGYDPDAVGMDEDYDACDLENWYLAIQSADGQVVIPSFHRPGILTAADWTAPALNSSGVPINVAERSKILRPRQADNSPLFPADPAYPDVNGKLTYDLDNDGDGVTDSVWLDLGYPVQRDPGGKMYKPLFAFMVLGLNGRLPLNTVGNLQARAIGDQATNASSLTYYNGAASPATPGSTSQVPYPGGYDYNGTTAPSFHPIYSSETYLDGPLWDHASHLGFSVNEINPKFALQNAPSNVYPSSGVTPSIAPNANAINYGQIDNAGVSVALTQLRNILAGTKPTDIPYPQTAATVTTTSNQDSNIVISDGQPLVFPNNVADNYDVGSTAATIGQVSRLTNAVPGRWGEPQGIPPILSLPNSGPYSTLNRPMLVYNNPVRAGRSVYATSASAIASTYLASGSQTSDSLDDDFDGTDPYLPPSYSGANFTVVTNLGNSNSTAAATSQDTLPLAFVGATTATSPTFLRSYPEFVDTIDGAGQHAVPSERIRRYVTPQDPAGVGRLVSFMSRPANDHDYGTGADNRGRMGYFRYFRPAGMPQEVYYPYANDTASGTNFPYTYATGSGTGQQYLMPVLIPAGYSANNGATFTLASQSDVFSNNLHGLQSMMTPALNTMSTPKVSVQTIAAFGAMPRDWDMALATNMPPTDTAVPVPDQTPAVVTNWSPTINPSSTILTNVNTENGPNLGSTGNGGNNGVYPIPYGDAYTSNASPYMNQPLGAPVVNGYLGGGLNKDEADEMNLYANNRSDMPFGPTDLEWLYRKQDVDGSTLSSRLSQLAPVSFNNPADGLTRRRLFSTDAFDLISFAYANDNPFPYAGGAYGASTDHNFSFNSRFVSNASPSLEVMNQVDPNNHYANPITTEFIPNPTLPIQTTAGGTIYSYIPNSSYSTSNAIALPRTLDDMATTNTGLFTTNLFTNAQVDPTTRLVIPSGGISGGVPQSAAQVQTPTVAHRDRRINLNYPLPISNDPAEPIRQKWCRETYQFLKAILPPASVDTPEELAQLSQYVVNIIDFRDPDCTMTRFVNTDLEVTDNLTHTAVNQQQSPPDLTWTVSVPGVKFATSGLPSNPLTGGIHFPYDPSIYNPDGDGAGNPTTFLVQHGMEYNPIAINEALAYQAQYGSPSSTTLTTYYAMFVELVNTLSEEQNNPSVTGTPNNANSSAINLAGWDILIAPDNFGWGRPDPISGDVNPAAWPLWIPNPSGTAGAPPVTTPASSSQRPHATTTDANLQAIQAAVQQYAFSASNAIIPALNSGTMNSTPNYFVIGDYRTGTGPTATSVPGTTVEGTTPIASPINLTLPTSFVLPTPPTTGTNAGTYYWVYLRRPANPFDTTPPDQIRPNKEMVVVDAMRFPVVNAGTATLTGGTVAASTGQVYSAQRLQPYRGGHLVRVDTTPPSGLPTSGPAQGATTICPPSPAYAYGYSEQMAEPGTGSGSGVYSSTPPQVTTATFKQTINAATPTPRDDPWSPFPFHDRDFASVAELLLVPGCPPGLFTKQFVEDRYPGNVFDASGNAATGTDIRDFAATVVAPTKANNPSRVGRPNFGVGSNEIPNPTYTYLPDNFYYTAASVAPPPPPAAGSYKAGYTRLTTEIGGWTGAGWHKMLEFFEVPSSANGAIGTADGGNNFDWARADTRPGQLNMNLIIDEEVFAGLIDDPRLNEALAAATSTIPFVVSQIDSYGYPAQDSSGNIIGRSPIFNQPSTNESAGGNPISTPPFTPNPNFGRGYVYRDPNIVNYNTTAANYPPYQQVHGIKAAFSDFLKLRHGGSGHLFGFGAGPTGSGDIVPGPLSVTASTPSHPIAAERPYRSLSYPDINYTILRPASLPPSPADSNSTPRYTPSTPPLPSANDAPFKGSLANMFQYQQDFAGVFPFVGLDTYLAPMNNANDTSVPTHRNFPYTQDPGVKNPYLPIQFINTQTPLNLPAVATPPASPMPPNNRYLGPPYAVQDPRPVYSTTTQPVIPSAPFPPPIPPTPARRLFQIPDIDQNAYGSYPLTGAPTPGTTSYSSNASLLGQYDNYQHQQVNNAINQATPTLPTDDQLAREYPINKPTIVPQLSTLPGYGTYAISAGTAATSPFSSSKFIYGTSPLPVSATYPAISALIAAPPSLVDQTRAIFQADNYYPLDPSNANGGNPNGISHINNHLGAGSDNVTYAANQTADHRMHPAYRTEWLQKISNLTTVRTHQYAVWITVGFFEVVQTGTPELGIPDAVGQELGLTAGKNVRYRSFFVIDRTKATGFNPYYPGNFRDCVTYRRRIE